MSARRQRFSGSEEYSCISLRAGHFPDQIHLSPLEEQLMFNPKLTHVSALKIASHAVDSRAVVFRPSVHKEGCMAPLKTTAWEAIMKTGNLQTSEISSSRDKLKLSTLEKSLPYISAHSDVHLERVDCKNARSWWDCSRKKRRKQSYEIYKTFSFSVYHPLQNHCVIHEEEITRE